MLLLAEKFNILIDDVFMKKLHLYEQTLITIFTSKKGICSEKDKEKCLIEYGKSNLDWACKRCDKNPNKS